VIDMSGVLLKNCIIERVKATSWRWSTALYLGYKLLDVPRDRSHPPRCANISKLLRGHAREIDISI
jgi:hypothetical protein